MRRGASRSASMRWTSGPIRPNIPAPLTTRCVPPAGCPTSLLAEAATEGMTFRPILARLLALVAPALPATCAWSALPRETPTAHARPARVVTLSDDAAVHAAYRARNPAWRRFAAMADGWSVLADARTERPAIAWGRGLPVLPGAGNALRPEDVGLASDRQPTLAEVESLVRRSVLLPHADLFGVEPSHLVLDSQASAGPLRGRLWSLDFAYVPDGVPVEGAYVGLRVNAGNLIQLGSVLLQPPPGPARPRLGPGEALALARAAVGEAAAEGPVDVLEPGTLVWFPRVEGRAILHDLAWRVRFNVPGEHETWEARLDALTGAVLTLHDANDWSCEPRTLTTAQVVGGVWAESPTVSTETGRSFMNAAVVNGTVKVTDRNGLYARDPGPASTSLSGRAFDLDCVTCTSPSQAFVQDDATGRLDLGFGGDNDEGNGASTRAERNAFFHANVIRALAVKWLPPSTVPWLDSTVPIRVNVDDTCNAFWNGVSLNMFHAGGGCGNTGEIAGIVQHEWGHGLDQATGRANDGARGEGFADHLDLIAHHRKEIGPGFAGTIPVRCVDWRTCDEAPGPLGTPLTRGNVATWCPAGGGSPLGRQVHCEGQIYGQTGWDLALNLVARYGSWGGWHVHESLFFPAALPSNTYLPDDVGGAYWAYVAADDDDGDLSNGTPHGAEIWDAFARHEIVPSSCGSHAGCLLPNVSSPPACTPPAPTAFTAAAALSPTDGASRVELDWPPDPAVATWNVYRTDFEADDGFLLIAAGVAAPPFHDDTVTNGGSFYYVVQPVGPGGCESLVATPQRVDISLPELRLESATVVDSPGGDGDGVPEPGEVLTVRARARNVGTTPATLVTGELRSDDVALVTIVAGTTPYPDIPPATTADPATDFQALVAADAWSCGSRAPLSVVFQSAEGCWAGALVVDIGAGLADVVAAGATALDTAPGSNGNGRPDPGETFDVVPSLLNAGPSPVGSATLEARTSDPFVTVVDGSVPLPDLAPGAVTAAREPLVLRLDPAAPCPGELVLELSIVGAEGCWIDTVTVPVGRRRDYFSDDFEQDRGWRYGLPADGELQGVWTRGIPNLVVSGGRPVQPGADASSSGTRCAITGNEVVAGSGEHADVDLSTSLVSPPVDLTGETRAELSYSAWRGSDRPDSELRVQARTGGGPWVTLRSLTGEDNAWRRFTDDVAGALGLPLGVVEVRFLANAPSPGGVFECAVDDVSLGHPDCEAPSPRPELALDSLALDDGAGGSGRGNRNGQADPGESLAFVPLLRNVRNAAARNVRVSMRLLAAPAGHLLLASDATAADLDAGAAGATEAPHLRLRLPSTASCGDEIRFELTATYEDDSAGSWFERLGTFTYPVGSWQPAPCDPFTDPACSEPVERIGAFHGFEGPGDAGWSHGIERVPGLVSDGSADDWQRKNPLALARDPAAAYEGASVFGTDLRAGGTDSAHDDLTRTFLESPAWDASRHSHVRLRYARWLSIQGARFDQATVSVNGAELWRNALDAPLADPACVDPFGAPAAYASDAEDMPEGPAGWKLQELDASASADHQPRVVARFDLQSDGRCNFGGWNVDAVELVGVPDVAACAPHEPCLTTLDVDAGTAPRLTCLDTTSTLSGAVLAGDGSFGYTYRWTPSAGLSAPDALSTVTDRPGTYTLAVTDVATGCTVTDTVVVADARTPPSAVASNDGALTCARSSATIRVDVAGGDGSLGFTYAWTPAGNLADPTAQQTTATSPGTYTCRVTDVATGCVSSPAFTTVTRDTARPTALAGPDRVSACFAPVTLEGAATAGNGAAGYGFAWTPAASLDDPASPTPSTNVPGTYRLTVTDLANGCTDTDDVVVTEPGDRLPAPEIGGALRVTRSGADLVLDLARYAWTREHSFVVHRDALPRNLPDATLDASSPTLLLAGQAGPAITLAGGAQGTGLACHVVHVQNACGVESR